MKDFGFSKNFDWVPKEVAVNERRVRYGIWEFGRTKRSDVFELKSISRTGLNDLLFSAGFRKLSNKPEILVQVVDAVIEQRSISDIKDFIKLYLDKISKEGVTLDSIEGHATKGELTELYLRQYSSVINEKYLEHLDDLDKPILRDTKNESYLLYQNAVIKVSHERIEQLDYSELTGVYVWRDQILPRDFQKVPPKNGHFATFIANVSENNPHRINAAMSAIGYLIHCYSKPGMGQAVILYDERIHDLREPQGGTGKGLFANAIRMMREVVKIDGKQMDPTSRFSFQQVQPSTQVIWIDDIESKFDFSALFSQLTDGITVEKKNQQSFLISREESPKILICSNTVLDSNGTSNKRRQFVLEFGDYYSSRINTGSEQPIIEEHGCVFFDNDDWSNSDWADFDAFMISCLQLYLQKGLQSAPPININRNQLIKSTSEDFAEWVIDRGFESNTRYVTKTEYEAFKSIYYGEQDKLSQRRFTFMLKHYATIFGLKHKVFTSGGMQYFELHSVK